MVLLLSWYFIFASVLQFNCVFSFWHTNINSLATTKTYASAPSLIGRRSCLRDNICSLQHEIQHREIRSFSLRATAESEISDPPRSIYGVLWLGLIIYAFTIAPGGSATAAAVDQELIMKMISNPFDGACNALFVAVFNFLGVIPAVLGALLLPGAKDQKLPALPFIISSFAVGFFGIGPYLGLREIRTNVSKTTQGTGTTAFEFKGTALLLLGFALYLYFYLASQILLPGSGGFLGVLRGYGELFASQRLVHVSSMDCAILSVAMWDPLREDMARRYTASNPSPLPAWAYCAVPAAGPALYLLLRPSLASSDDK